jgi:glycosyltransferase involved in cell wall biosynthesis
MTTQKILFCSIDAPFIGGAGTNSYNMIKLLRSKLKYTVSGLYLYTNDNLDKDPHNIGGIHKYNPSKDKIAVLKATLIKDLGGFPDLILAKNYISVLISKKIFPQTKLFFLPSGSSFYGHYCARFGQTPIIDLINDLETGKKTLSSVTRVTGKYPCWPSSCQSGCDCELRAYIMADKIIPNSHITERLFKGLYGNIKSGIDADHSVANKVNSFIETSALYDCETIMKTTKNINFENRKYDVIFACYSWKRNLKNMDLVNKIIKDVRMKNVRIVIIGNDSQKAVIPVGSKTMTVGCVDNKKMFEYLGDTRCYVCPSYYDSYPNMITEADLSGCNTVSSLNVGQHNRLAKELLVINFNSVDEWVTKILKAVDQKHSSLLIDQTIILQNLKNIIS